MRRISMNRSMNLLSASVIAMAVAASPAAAQTTDPATPPDPTVEAQEQPADPEAGAAETDDAVQTATGQDQATSDADTIVVTGLRRSLQSAQNIKRNSEQIVDAIVAEDIGKLPDTAVSDTAARIPGVQVERGGGEAGNVLLRGLDEVYYATTYNGREIFTAETRSVALQDFPAGGISAIEAFKTSTANLVEPGLAGLINVRSRRPFDFRGLEVAGSVWGVYPNQSRDLTPNAQILVSNRWNMGEGEIGALLNFSYTNLHYRDSIRRHMFGVWGLAGGVSPDWPQIIYDEGNRKRPSLNGALQYRVGDLELYAEGLWQGFREKDTDRAFEQPLWNCGEAVYSDVVIDSEGNVVSGSVSNPGCSDGPGAGRGFQAATKRRTNTYQFAIGGRYDLDALRITADIARTSSRFDHWVRSLDYQLANNDYVVNWFTGRPGDDGPTFEVVGFDFEDPANYEYRGFFQDRHTAKGDDWQARLDFEYEPSGIDFVRNVQWGARYVNRDASARGGANYAFAGCGYAGPPGSFCSQFPVPISDLPFNYQLSDRGFRGDENKPYPMQWLAPSYSNIWDNLDAIRQFNVDNGFASSADEPGGDLGRTFRANEKSYAAYAQVNYLFNLGGEMTADGALGLRAVKTKTNVQGTLFGSGGPEPIDFKNSYTDWLPNANMRIRFSPQWQLRLAATQTRTRPTFVQLNPALSLGSPPVGCDPDLTECVRTGSGGNPFLKPLDSNNYDASLEYYFSPTGFASVAAFYRDMKGFITRRAFRFEQPDPETGLPLLVSGPVNTNQATIKGWEAQVSTFFDWDFVPTWARAFGMQANVTYIDAKADFLIFTNPTVEDSGTELRARIPDVSKWTYNLVGMYEAGGLTARLAYNKRTHYPEGALLEEGAFTRQGRGRGSSRLDWSSSYTVNDNVTLFFDWTNILGKPFRSDIVRTDYNSRDDGEVVDVREFPMLARFEETVISSGIRFRFGGAAPQAAPAPAPVLPPPPPPVVEPAPVEVAPPPPPPPPPTGERG